MLRRTLMTAAVAAAALFTSAAAPDPLYTLASATVLPSTDSDWDYIKLEPNGSRLFIARRKDGLTVYDVDTNRVVGQIENSVGANGPLLLPEFDRGYVAMTDGSLLSFNLTTLAVIERLPLATDGGLNGVVYDPATKRIHAVVGSRTTESAWFTLDAATGALIETTVFPFKKMDDPSPDGQGVLYAPARYDGVILKLDSRTLEERGRIAVNCQQVSKVHYQEETDRLLIGCRGDAPSFLALEPASGRELVRIPIGAGIDGMAIDTQRNRILTSNGGSSNITVIQQDGPDAYRLLGNVQTRPQARVMQIDPRNGMLWTVTADATFGAPDAEGKSPPPTFHPNSFSVLAYRPF